MVKSVLIFLLGFFIYELLGSLWVKLLFATSIIVVNSIYEILFFGFMAIVDALTIFSTVHNEVVVNALELLLNLLFSFYFDFTCGWNFFVFDCLGNLMAFELDLWLLGIFIKFLFFDLFELHESIGVGLQVPYHVFFKQKVICGGQMIVLIIFY